MTIDLTGTTRLADPADVAKYGAHRRRTDVSLTGRITGEAARYHLYGGWFCPWSQRVAITRELAGLRDVVTMSYVDDERDARGWAFRERYGPDPVNGFTLLSQAYEATDPAFRGYSAVPTLWDRRTSTVVSNDETGIGIDLATRFGHLATGPVTETYPPELRAKIDAMDRWLRPAVNEGISAAAAGPGPARDLLLDAFELLDGRLAHTDYLVGEALTEADIRLWVTLIRYDAAPNARRTINPGLHVYPHLWRYTRALYEIPAFRDTTNFASFTVPGTPTPGW